jgi:magnesium chelatase family protein
MDEITHDDKPTISSKQMFEKVLIAFKMQKGRGQIELNGKMNDSDIAKYCKVDDESQKLLNQAVSRFDLTQRGINKTLKVARTIADLDESDTIKKAHLMESLSFRMKK